MTLTTTRRLAKAAIITLAFTATACGGGNANTTNNTTNNAANNTTNTAPQTKSLILYQYKFNPNTLTVPVGTTVVFKNKDPEQHNVTIQALNVDQMLKANGEWSYTFSATGEYAVTNRLSNTPMQATIIVK